MQVLNESNFEQTCQNGLVLVDFFATWCGPCKALSPILEEVENDFKEKIKIVKVDVEASPDLLQKFKITAVPTLIFLKDFKEIERIQGAQSKAALIKYIQKLI